MILKPLAQIFFFGLNQISPPTQNHTVKNRIFEELQRSYFLQTPNIQHSALQMLKSFLNLNDMSANNFVHCLSRFKIKYV